MPCLFVALNSMVVVISLNIDFHKPLLLQCLFVILNSMVAWSFFFERGDRYINMRDSISTIEISWNHHKNVLGKELYSRHQPTRVMQL